MEIGGELTPRAKNTPGASFEAVDSPQLQSPDPQSRESKGRALIALLLLVPVPSIGAAAAMFWWTDSTVGKLIFGAAKLWIVLLPLIWLRMVDRERISFSPPRLGGFRIASASGVLIALVIFAAYALVRGIGGVDPALVAESAARTGLDRFGLYLGGALFWITLNSLMEEYVWRWFVFGKFEALFGGRTAVVAAALAFTAHHVVALAAQFSWPITLIGSLGVFTGGAIWSWLYLRFRSVWPCYVSHAIADIPIFVIGWWLIFGRVG